MESFSEYQEIENGIQNPLYHNLYIGTILWVVIAVLMGLFLSPEYFSVDSWSIIVVSDIVCIYVIRFRGANVKNVYLYSMITGLIQMTYLVHRYDFHLAYILLLIGTSASTAGSMIHADNKHIWSYGIFATICSLSILFIDNSNSELVAFGFSSGIIFFTATTFANKKLKNENIRIRTQLEEAKKYAHDINSPLSVVKGRIHQVLREENLDPRIRNKLENADKSADKIASIVKAVD